MANVIITLKVMPESPETDLVKIKEEVTKIVAEFKGEVGKFEEERLAFGLKALKFIFVIEESLGATDDMEAKASEVEGVQSVEVIDVRRAVG